MTRPATTRSAMTEPTIGGDGAGFGEAAVEREAHDRRFRAGARVAGLGALALGIAAAAALWASEGARVFAEAAFSAMLACL